MASHQSELEQMLEVLRAFDMDIAQSAEARDLLAVLEQVRSSAEAAQAQVMMHMHREALRDDLADDAASAASGTPVLVPTGRREEFVVDEIALHLRCTRVAASHRFGVALAAHQHPPLVSAWRAGRIDGRKVQIIADGLVGTGPVFADTLAGSAVDYAATHTGPQLRTWLTRRVITHQPEAAEERRQRATAGRRIRLVPLPDGVAELSALMPAVQARHLFDTLTALAHTADGTGDIRTLDQRRSDALYDLTTGRANPPDIHLSVTVPANTLMSQCDEPGELAGYGPVTAYQIREAAGLAGGRCTCRDLDTDVIGAQVVVRRLLTEPTTGVLTDVAEVQYRPSPALDRAVRARDLTCRFPGCRRPATTARNGVDLDHTVPWPRGETSAGNLTCLCRHHHRLKHMPGWSATHHPDGVLEWLTPTGHRFTTHPWHYTDPPLRPSPPTSTDPPEPHEGYDEAA